MARLIPIGLLLALALLAPGSAGAQAQPASARIDQLQIAIWPEYDRPGVLVVYRLVLAPDTQLPAKVAVPIPASVGDPHAVAWRGPDGPLLVAPFTRSVDGERAIISMELGGIHGQLEFYDELNIQGRKRSYTFSWPGGVELGALSFEVQQPLGAGTIELSPPPDRWVEAPDGMTYTWTEFGPQTAEARPALILTYAKDTHRLSVEQLQALGSPAEAPPPPSAPAPAGGSLGFPWLLGGLGGVLVAFGIGWYLWPSGGSAAPAAAEPGARRPQRERAMEGRAGAAAAFCHSCGTKVDASDAFCRSCGTELRRD
jgi:hypothetical protein